MSVGNSEEKFHISHSVADRLLHTLKLEVQSELSFHMEEGSSDKSLLIMGQYIHDQQSVPLINFQFHQ